MDHLAYYNVGCEPGSGGSRLKVWIRRQFRKVLLPSSRRMVQILVSLCTRLDVTELEVRDLQRQLADLQRRHDDVATKLPATIAFGWDYVAMVRRLAVLEEHVDALLIERSKTHESAAPELIEVPTPKPTRAVVG